MAKSTATYKISVQASTEHLSEVRDFVSEHATDFGFNSQEVADIRLAVDEAYTNIIKHAYQNNADETVDIELGYDKSKFWVTLLDTGNTFDISNYSKPDICQRIKDKKRGGVGVFLIQKLMDDVEYQTEDSTNTIRMTKKK